MDAGGEGRCRQIPYCRMVSSGMPPKASTTSTHPARDPSLPPSFLPAPTVTRSPPATYVSFPDRRFQRSRAATAERLAPPIAMCSRRRPLPLCSPRKRPLPRGGTRAVRLRCRGMTKDCLRDHGGNGRAQWRDCTHCRSTRAAPTVPRFARAGLRHGSASACAGLVRAGRSGETAAGCSADCGARRGRRADAEGSAAAAAGESLTGSDLLAWSGLAQWVRLDGCCSADGVGACQCLGRHRVTERVEPEGERCVSVIGSRKVHSQQATLLPAIAEFEFFGHSQEPTCHPQFYSLLPCLSTAVAHISSLPSWSFKELS